MVVRRPAEDRTEEAPEGFRRAVATLREARLRPEVVLHEAPAPQRLAPFAVAMTADVLVDDEELATGRLVVLHDPEGQDAWSGMTRLVGYLRAECEAEMAADPLLPQVGWAWLLEALEARGAAFGAASGTVTRVASESFGGLAQASLSEAQLELRASWSPLDDDLGRHLGAFTDLLCTAAGLPPIQPGVVPIPARRGRSRYS